MNTFPITRIEVDINSIFPNKWNPNLQSDKMFKSEVGSIKNFGFIDAVLVREIDVETYEIIDGEHRWRACKELGYEKILCDNLGKVDDSVAQTLTLMMNNVRGQDNILKRAEMLKKLKEGQLQLLPFSKSQIDEELKLLDFDFSDFDNAQLEKDKIDLYNEALKVALQLERKLKDLHNESKDTKMKLLLENYFLWLDTFKQVK